MLVSFDEVLSLADKGGFAIPAFNVYNMETVMGIIAAAEEKRAPVILQFYSRLAANEEGYYLSPIILAAAAKATVPAAVPAANIRTLTIRSLTAKRTIKTFTNNIIKRRWKYLRTGAKFPLLCGRSSKLISIR